MKLKRQVRKLLEKIILEDIKTFKISFFNDDDIVAMVIIKLLAKDKDLLKKLIEKI